MSEDKTHPESETEFGFEETSSGNSLSVLEEENRRLKLQLENARLELELAQQKDKLKTFAGQVDPDGSAPVTPQPKAGGGSPVPRAPINPGPANPPKEGDEVFAACRSGARDAKGQKCPGRRAILTAKIGGRGGIAGGSSRRVIYKCLTCGQSWNVTY